MLNRDYYIIQGSVDAQKRQAIVTAFNSPEDTAWVVLVNVKAGGVGINLVGASRVVLYDSSWNPTVEAQVSSGEEERSKFCRAAEDSWHVWPSFYLPRPSVLPSFFLPNSLPSFRAS